ncbi:MAG: ACP S-malonyltransferase [Microscillaceae bacterium]
MKAYLFPGQGAQFAGMGQNLYQSSEKARQLFEQANEILGFRITDLMFDGSDEDLRQTNVTQPAIFLHSVVLALTHPAFYPDMVAGHSLGEFSALTAVKSLSFEDGLRLVAQRAQAMQKACEAQASTMAAVLGLEDTLVETITAQVQGIVVPANYNCPGQLVISGTEEAIDKAIELLKTAGAKRAVKLAVGGAFHSPLMEPARAELAAAIEQTHFEAPQAPVYQNFTAEPALEVEKIKANLIAQLTGPVRWTQTVQALLRDGAQEFIEVGPGQVLQGLVKKVERKLNAYSLE